EIPYIITGGTMNTSTFVIDTINTAFSKNKVGLASAMAVILLVIIIIVTLLQKYFFREDGSKLRQRRKTKEGKR
ncbi:MAG: sugar ABC transporter permease, partial [Ruminococcus sp.]|nr:sugar ABC transporter permease [Ruminococcus sp.]